MSRHLKKLKTKKNVKISRKFHLKNKKFTKYNKIQKGGEVVTLDNFDYDRLRLYNKMDVDWKGFPGSPPDPKDCTIL